MCLMSRPRAQTLVATKIFLTLSLKSWIVNSRSVWSMPPCNTKDLYPILNNSLNNWSASTYFSTKTKMLPFSYHSPRSSISFQSFSSSDWSTSTFCSTDWHVWPRLPTTISRGAFRIVFARDSIDLGKVAENITVYLSGLQFWRITLIYGSKPISSILSASSSTT